MAHTKVTLTLGKYIFQLGNDVRTQNGENQVYVKPGKGTTIKHAIISAISNQAVKES